MGFVRDREQRSTAARHYVLQKSPGRWLLVEDDDGEVRARIDATYCEHCTDAEACGRCRRKAITARVAVDRHDSWQGFTISSANLVKFLLGNHYKKENR